MSQQLARANTLTDSGRVDDGLVLLARCLLVRTLLETVYGANHVAYRESLFGTQPVPLLKRFTPS